MLCWSSKAMIAPRSTVAGSEVQVVRNPWGTDFQRQVNRPLGGAKTACTWACWVSATGAAAVKVSGM